MQRGLPGCDASLLYLDDAGSGSASLIVRVEGSVRPEVGSPLTLRLLPQDLHLFDAAGLACRRIVDLPT